MISLQDLLSRFRRALVPPGPALARAAPPVDVAARLRAEVAPVLEAIAELQERATQLKKEGDERAAQLIDAATSEAERNIRSAERKAPEARAAAVEDTHRGVEGEIATIDSEGNAETKRIAAQTDERLPDLVATIRDCLEKGVVTP